jgi:hypothetical protein
MKHNSARAAGQQNVTLDPQILVQVQVLCDFMQMLRAWYEHFEESLRQVDRAAAVKAHDLMVEGVIVARQIARQLGFVLPDVAGLTWEVAPRPVRLGFDL